MTENYLLVNEFLIENVISKFHHFINFHHLIYFLLSKSTNQFINYSSFTPMNLINIIDCIFYFSIKKNLYYKVHFS